MKRYRYASKDEIGAAVLRLVAQEFDVRESEVSLEAVLVTYGPDSLASVQLALALEEEFDVDIPDEVVTTLTSAQSIVTFVVARLKAASRVRADMPNAEVKARLRIVTDRYFDLLHACVRSQTDRVPEPRVKGTFADAQRDIARVLGDTTAAGVVLVDSVAASDAIEKLEMALDGMRGDE